MSKKNLQLGDLVRFTRGEHEGLVGVITQPITPEQPDPVLPLKEATSEAQRPPGMTWIWHINPTKSSLSWPIALSNRAAM